LGGEALKTASNDAISDAGRCDMRTTVIIDEKLLADAQERTGIKKNSELLNEGLRSLIQRDAARRLIALGGSEPGLKVPPRRRPPRFINK
jgi:Arc/MetJ family transcription regulator